MSEETEKTEIIDPEPLEAEPAAEKVVPKPHDHRIDFVEDLSTMLSKADADSYIKALDKGIFVNEFSLDSITDIYSSWLKKNIQNLASDSKEKLRQRLFGTETPKPVYIFDGKQAVAGYFIDLPLPKARNLGLLYYQGNPVDASGHIHPTDPIYSRVKNIDVRKTQTGLELRIVHGARSFKISPALLDKFAREALYSRRTLREYPRYSGAQRDALPILAHLISKARPQRDKDFCICPWEIKKEKANSLLRVGHFVFAVNQEDQVVDCYSIKDKGLLNLVWNEISPLMRPKQKQKLKNFQFFTKKGKAFGEVKTLTRKYPITIKAFMQFLNIFPFIAEGLKAPKVYTVLDALKILTDIYQQADPIREPHKLKNKPAHVSEIRVNKDMEFHLGKNSTILEIQQSGSQKKGQFKKPLKQNKKQHQNKQAKDLSASQ
ncbi:MAG: hypothetical protein H6619_03625 [Deltaproteobacteria bacterium]|nr:hypothetical protein [Deltaproteobacteria bacterium]